MNQVKIEMLALKGKNLYTEFYNPYPHRPTIVFLHDSLGCVKLWRDFPKKLSEATQCNVLIYDRLGYGKSDSMPTYVRGLDYMEIEAEVLHDLLMMFKIENPILFGHSDGGTIALLSGSKYPDLIKAIIVEAAHIFVEDITLNGIAIALESYQNTNLPQRLAKYHSDKVDTIFRAWSETWTTKAFRDWNIEHFLADIICPLLFIQGSEDEYGTIKQVERTLAQVSGAAEKLIIPNVGHTPHKENPEVVLEKSIEFLKSFTA